MKQATFILKTDVHDKKDDFIRQNYWALKSLLRERRNLYLIDSQEQQHMVNDNAEYRFAIQSSLINKKNKQYDLLWQTKGCKCFDCSFWVLQKDCVSSFQNAIIAIPNLSKIIERFLQES